MPDVFERLIRRAGVWEYIRGNTGVLGDGLVSRDTLVSGTYNPVYYSGNPAQGGNYATNRVGIYGLSSLTSEQEGTNLTYTVNGQTIANVNFFRRVSVAAQNVTFINCLFQGTVTDFTTPLTCGTASVNATFIDCTFAPLAPQYNTPCARVGVGGGTFIRCDFYGGTDGLSGNSTSGWPSQWNFIQCAFHDMLYTSPDPDAAGGLPDNASHVDAAIQWNGGKLSIEGCGIWGFLAPKYQANQPNTPFGTGGTTTDNTTPYPYHFTGNKYTDTVADPGDSRTPAAVIGAPSIYTLSCIMFSPVYRNIEFFSMNNCFIDGATWALNISPNFASNYGAFAGAFNFTNNKIGKNHRWALHGTNKAIIAQSSLQAGMTITGNTDLATGAAVDRTAILTNG